MTPTWQKPLRWWAPWRTRAVRREWDRQVRCMDEAGFRRTGWLTWESTPMAPEPRKDT